MIVPNVITRTPRGERGMDLLSALLAENIVCISGPIDDYVANLVIAQIIFLEGENPDRDISLYINSPGGSVTAVLAIYDTIQYVLPDVSTICLGQAVSVSAMLVAGGTPGKRFALPNAKLLITQPSLEQIGGCATDFEIYAKEILRLRSLITQILARHTGQSIARIESDIERDLILSASQARDYGLIDTVQLSRTDEEIKSLALAGAMASAQLIG